MNSKHVRTFLITCVAIVMAGTMSNAEAQSNYDDLLLLFSDWRTFESPPLLEGAPDYTAAQFTARQR